VSYLHFMVNGYKLVEKLSWYYKLWAKPKAFDKKCQMLKKTYQNYLLDEAYRAGKQICLLDNRK